MRESRAQSAIELMLIVGAALFFIIGLTIVFQQEVTKRSIEKRKTIMTELVLTIQNEINLAARSSDGYTRYFEIPETLAGKEYSVGIYDGFLYLNTTDNKLAFGLPTHNVTGQLKKNRNIIKKINSTIFVN